ncbi:MAG: hypothetical protein HYR67_00650 [Bacteroidetes bacterium]|nr:hypothetical protein [Bacteroidota bacterium]
MKKVIITAQELSRLIILLATSSNLPKIVISRTYHKLSTPDLGAFAHDTVHCYSSLVETMRFQRKTFSCYTFL